MEYSSLSVIFLTLRILFPNFREHILTKKAQPRNVGLALNAKLERKCLENAQRPITLAA